ncbi:MAG: AAA family ATPase [Aquabacterium sp.]
MSLSPTVRRVCLLGGESSGKTTLAMALAQALGTVWVPEYGRERFAVLGPVFSPADLVETAEQQVQREEAALTGAQGWLVCDTSPLTTLVYGLVDHGEAAPALWTLAQRPYDRVLLCEPDFGFVQDGARRDHDFRARQHALHAQLLARFGMRWVAVRGEPAERLQTALAALSGPAEPA